MGYAFASVVETVQLNKRLRRIVLEVPELDRLQLPKAGDAAVGIYFPDANRPKRPPPMECRQRVGLLRRNDCAAGTNVLNP